MLYYQCQTGHDLSVSMLYYQCQFGHGLSVSMHYYQCQTGNDLSAFLSISNHGHDLSASGSMLIDGITSLMSYIQNN